MKLLSVLFTIAAVSTAQAVDNTATFLDAAVRAACPQIDGVTVGDPSSKGTWSIQFHAATAVCQAAANTALAAFVAPAPGTPFEVSSMQAKVALSRAGLLSSVQTWVATQSVEDQLVWSTAGSFRRNSALLNSAAAALGLTSAQVDALFITAAGINP